MKFAIDFIESTLFIAEIGRTLAAEFYCSVSRRQNFERLRCDLRRCRTVGRFFASRYKSHETLHGTLIPVAERRLEERAQQKLGHIVASHVWKSSHFFAKC